MTQLQTADIYRHFSSGTTNIRQALEQTGEDMLRIGLDPMVCDTSQIILGEVLNNVVEHAYDMDEGRPITLSIWLADAGLRCEVNDEGVPMPNGVPPAGTLPDVHDIDRDALPEGGFGWAMVRELTQDLQYHRADNTNRLRFVIPLSRP